MQQSVLIQPQSSRVEARPMPTVGPEDVLVQVKVCGVCASELHGWQGDSRPYPREYGHETAGIVVEVGSAVQAYRPGMAVTGLAGKGYAQYVSANQHHLVPIPEGISFEQALGEPLGCVMSGARRTRVDMGDTVAVVGLGFMGLLALQAIRLRGPAYLIAIDPRPHAREMACRLGADVTYAPEEVDAKWKLTEWNQLGKGYGVDVAVEASGTQAGLTLAGQMVHEHGMLSLVGYHQGGPRLVDMELWNWKALDVLNAHERRTPYLVECIVRGLALVKAGRLDVGTLVTHRFPLECVDEAFGALQTKPEGFVKAVIVP